MLQHGRSAKDVRGIFIEIGIGMKVSWSKKAAKSAQTTTTYSYKEFGLKSSQKFLSEISHVCQLLEDNPYLGPIEPLLIDKKKQYRSVVDNHLNKLVYYIKGDIIRIAAVWDTRREPKSQANQLK